MPMQFSVSPVCSEDHPRLVDVWELSVRATHDFLTEADIARLKPLVIKGLPTLPQLFCVRDDMGQALGFVGVTEANIDVLFIHPDWRGRGLGRLLTNYAVTELGATTVDVNEQNGQAIGFYLELGFEVTGRSDTDMLGLPFPLLHMRLSQR